MSDSAKSPSDAAPDAQAGDAEPTATANEADAQSDFAADAQDSDPPADGNVEFISKFDEEEKIQVQQDQPPLPDSNHDNAQHSDSNHEIAQKSDSNHDKSPSSASNHDKAPSSDSSHDNAQKSDSNHEKSASSESDKKQKSSSSDTEVETKEPAKLESDGNDESEICYKMSDDEEPKLTWGKGEKKEKPKEKGTTFVTGIEDENRVKKISEKPKKKPGDDLFKEVVEVKHEEPKPKPKPKPRPRPQQQPEPEPKLESSYRQKRRLSTAMMQFLGLSPTIPVAKQVDLSKYDDEDFDWEENSKDVPPGLMDIITHSEFSIVFRAICGESMVNYPPPVVSRVVHELKKYLNTCIKRGMIAEASYLQGIIEDIQYEMKDLALQRGLGLEKVNQRLTQAEDNYERKKNQWASQKAMLDTEKDISLEDLELRYQEEASKLDEDWNSEQMQAKFNRPSATLMEMRQNAKGLLNTHRFEEAALVAEAIHAREAQETEEAAKKMRQEYQVANDRLRQKFESDRKVMLENFDHKKNGLTKAEESNLKLLSQRIEKYQRMKDTVNARRAKYNVTKPDPQRRMVATTKHPVTLDGRLRLPPLGSKAKPKSKSQLS